MILGSVGTDPRGFQRLVDWLDALAPALGETIVIQVGHTPRLPVHAAWVRFEPQEAFQKRVAAARVLVTHAGAGTLLASAEAGVPAVCVPRQRALGEAVDDHQAELAAVLADRPGFAAVSTPHELAAALRAQLGRPSPPGRELVGRLREDVAELAQRQGRT